MFRRSGRSRSRPQDGDSRQHGHGTVDTHREQAARCVHAAGRAHATGPTPDRGGRRSERRQEFRAGELRRQVNDNTNAAGSALQPRLAGF